jgi:hypothetical protein
MVYSFHGGPPLNIWERCCLQSFADYGHETVLFSYDRLDVPRGVQLESAADIISIEQRDRFFAAAPELYSQFSDFFRYEVLHRHGGWWVDTDVLCRSSHLPTEPVVVGETQPGKIGTAIMRFPAEHPIMREARDYCISHQSLVASSHRQLLGPMLMTDLISRSPVQLSGVDLFYPVRGLKLWWLGEPDKIEAVKAMIAESPMVHLFQELLRVTGLPRDVLPPKKSFLADAFAAHGGQSELNISLAQFESYKPKSNKERRQAARGMTFFKRLFPSL